MNQFVSEKETPLTNYRHLLVGDLSGIQEFIFNTQSEGAAKTLKARSYYVQAVSEIALELVKKVFLPENCLLFYNGGGNFYVFLKNYEKTQLTILQEDVQLAMADEELYLSLSIAEIKNEFGDTWKDLHSNSNVDKLKKYTQRWDAFDNPKRNDTNETEREKWKEFVKPFANEQETTGFIAQPTIGSFRVSRAGLGWADWQVSCTLADKRFVNSIINKLPVWDTPLRDKFDDLIKSADERNRTRVKIDPKKGPHKDIENGDIIEFEILGQMAQKRTGTDKIAVLKMDADHLGNKFLHFTNTDNAKELSDLLKKFFEDTMLGLWRTKFEYLDREGQKNQEPFFHNIYPVFSGGDDCIFIGGWDAVFEFAKVVQERFKKDITSQYPETPEYPALTLSASLTMFDSKYPVVRLAQIAEDAIKSAKSAGRDRITVFEEVLTWGDFNKAHEVAKQLEILIKVEGEARGILERIKLSHRGYARLQDQALSDTVSNPAIWRLFYFIRKTKNLAALESVINQYERAILDVVISKVSTNPATFPVAARWAEFLTR